MIKTRFPILLYSSDFHVVLISHNFFFSWTASVLILVCVPGDCSHMVAIYHVVVIVKVTDNFNNTSHQHLEKTRAF